MLKEKWFSHLSYLAVGIASLLLSVFVASRFVQPSYSQINSDSATTLVTSESVNNDTAADSKIENKDDVPTNAAVLTNNPVGEKVVMPSQNNEQILMPEVSFLEPYVYDTREGRRNPFRPPLLADGSLPDVVLPGTPLERYELDELKIAAIMWDVNAPRAMVLDPQGEVHILGKDDRIGRKRGYIAVIREGEVVVVETANFNGENTFSTRIMRIEK